MKSSSYPNSWLVDFMENPKSWLFLKIRNLEMDEKPNGIPPFQEPSSNEKAYLWLAQDIFEFRLRHFGNLDPNVLRPSFCGFLYRLRQCCPPAQFTLPKKNTPLLTRGHHSNVPSPVQSFGPGQKIANRVQSSW